MKEQSRHTQWKLAAAFAALSLTGFSATTNAATQDPVWDQWLTSLKTQGFAVTQGISAPRDCATFITVFGNCLNNNPGGGYIDILPPIDNSYVDPCYNPAHDCSGATPNTFTTLATLPNGGQASVNQFYRLDSTDALVLIVNLPPNAAYLGYQSYVYSRPSSSYSKTACSSSSTYPDPCRTPVMGSVGNAINNVSVLKQSGLALGGSGSVAFITTSNQALYNSLSTAFTQAGGAASRLFAEPLAQKIVGGPYTATVYPGLDSSADEMSSIIRYSVPQSESDADAWQAALSSNVQVFRIRNTSLAASRYASTSLVAKHYSTDESSYKQAVDELTSDLKGWLQTQTTSKVKTGTLYSSTVISKKTGLPSISFLGVDILGPYCILKGKNCLRDTQDTDSYRTWVLSSSLTRTAAVVGVDATQTGNASYIGIGVSDYTILEGVASLTQSNPQATGFSSGALTGSATDLVNQLTSAGLIPAPSATLTAALPKLFVAFATRSCPAGTTGLICSKPYTVNIDATALPTDHKAELTRRSYVHPGDANGPNPNYLYPTQVVY